jgi:hypothetical protein
MSGRNEEPIVTEGNAEEESLNLADLLSVGDSASRLGSDMTQEDVVRLDDCVIHYNLDDWTSIKYLPQPEKTVIGDYGEVLPAGGLIGEEDLSQLLISSSSSDAGGKDCFSSTVSDLDTDLSACKPPAATAGQLDDDVVVVAAAQKTASAEDVIAAPSLAVIADATSAAESECLADLKPSIDEVSPLKHQSQLETIVLVAQLDEGDSDSHDTAASVSSSSDSDYDDEVDDDSSSFDSVSV